MNEFKIKDFFTALDGSLWLNDYLVVITYYRAHPLNKIARKELDSEYKQGNEIFHRVIIIIEIITGFICYNKMT